MTAYNRERYIAEAIESVLASTYQNWELIIVDDHSKDQTIAIARSYEAKDNRIKVYINEKNLGDYPNRNKAATYAKGEFILYVDSDDCLKENTLSNVVDTIARFPLTNFALYSPLKINDPLFISAKEIIHTHFFETPILMYGPVAMILRKSFFEKINGFPEKYGPANDMYFNLKAASDNGCLLLPFELVNYRRHAGQEINNYFSYLYNNHLYMRDALNELNLPLTENELKYLSLKNKRRFSVNILKYFFNTFNFKKTASALAKSKFTLRDFMQGLFHYFPAKFLHKNLNKNNFA
jgi:glycosyltransferase involved in cell wall biosynthesis